MQRPMFITTEKKDLSDETSGLIVDKTGIIGERLAKKLSLELLVTYVRDVRFPSVPKNYYSHIFIIDDGTKTTRDALPKFIDKAEKDNSQLVFAVHISEINQKPILKIINNPKCAKIIIYGDIFSQEKIHDYKTSQFIVNKFIYQAQKFRALKIAGDGLKKTHPVFLDDVISGILEVAFGSNRSSSIFYLFPKHAPTEISLAHMIQKANPNVAIDFVKTKEKRKEKIILPVNGKYLLEDDYELHLRIRKIFLEESIEHHINKRNEYFATGKNDYNFLPLVGFLYLIFILLLPLITTWFFSRLGFKMLENAKEEMDKGQLINTEGSMQLAKTYFSLARKTSQPLLLEAKLIGKSNNLETITRNIVLGEDVSKAGLYFVNSLNKYSLVFSKKSQDPKNDFIDAGVMLKNSMVVFQKIQAENNLPLTLTASINNVNSLIKFVSGSIDILPNIFGFEGAKTYLILFQNNLELRPTGGFIGYFGLLTIDRGAVSDFSIQDVYEIDSQLKGHVEPPYPIRRYLQTQHWYLRDSNFDIDFVKSASKSAYFLDVETNKKADGVVAIDLSFLKKETSKKPVYLTDYKQLVDKNNLLDVFQKNNSIFSLIKVISDALAKKHLLFAFASPPVQDFFTVNNWSGSLWDKRAETETNINDFVGINEANLGGNNANFFVKRKVSQNITLDNNGKVFGKLSIVYNNTSSHSLPNGDYKNYLRIILQKDASLLSISINGLEQPIVKAITDPKIYESKKFIPPVGLEVEKTEEDGKAIYGFLVNVPSGKKQTINIKYSLAKIASLNQPLLIFNLFFFKQPGTDEYPFEFTFSYPSEFHPIKIAKGFAIKEGKVFVSKILNSDGEVSISLAKE